MNKTSLLLFSVCVIFLCACGNTSSKKSKDTDKKTADKVVGVKPDKHSGGIEKVPLFTECKNYNNDLSAISSEVEFAAFDMTLPLSGFHVYDVAITDKYIFVMQMYNIIQYDLNGKFIRSIGSKGRGLKEYLQLHPPLSLDRENKLIYATDCRGNKVQAYDYEGKFIKTFPLTTAFMNARLIDSSTFAMPQHEGHRYRPNAPLVRFVDGKGKSFKVSCVQLPASSNRINLLYFKSLTIMKTFIRFIIKEPSNSIEHFIKIFQETNEGKPE